MSVSGNYQTSNTQYSNPSTNTEGRQTPLTAEETAILHVATHAGITKCPSSGNVTITNVSGEQWKNYIDRVKSSD